MPFRDPLTTQQLQEIQERNRDSKDVMALLWEIKRLRSVILRADQAYRSNVFAGGLIADLLKADLDKEPVVIQDRALSKTLFDSRPTKPPIMGKD